MRTYAARVQPNRTKARPRNSRTSRDRDRGQRSADVRCHAKLRDDGAGEVGTKCSSDTPRLPGMIRYSEESPRRSENQLGNSSEWKVALRLGESSFGKTKLDGVTARAGSGRTRSRLRRRCSRPAPTLGAATTTSFVARSTRYHSAPREV